MRQVVVSPRWLLIAGLVVGASSACDGRILEPVGGGSTPNHGATINTSCSDTQLDFTPIRLLNKDEYNHVVRDVLGDDSSPLAFGPSDAAEGFTNNAYESSITPRLAEHYQETAETVAMRAMSRGVSFVGCDGSTGEPACVDSFVTRVGRQLFRRPVTAEETARLRELFMDVRGALSFMESVGVVLQGMLQSTPFLYHVEIGAPSSPGVVKLTGYEVASRLSFFLWGSTPDEDLYAAAEAGELETADQVAAQAARMFDDPRARMATASFHTQWLQLGKLDDLTKDAALYPDFTPALRNDLRQETLSFLEQLIWDERGTVSDMMSAPYSVLNAELADYYGMSVVAGDEFEKVDFAPSEQRFGLLTQGSLLAINAHYAETSPVHRGKFVRERILCQDLPPPPNNVPALPAPTAGGTVRERLDLHRTEPSCANCHVLIDPIGYTFENYDAIGRWRDVDEFGRAIDSRGELTKAGDASGVVSGARELAERLAMSEDVSACVTEQWYRFAMGRNASNEDDCTLERLSENFRRHGRRISDLMIEITKLDAFRFRVAPDVAEDCQ